MYNSLIITFVAFAFACNGLGNLYLFLIREGQLFSFMQKALKHFEKKNVFIYKSIGGCETCTIQRFADIAFIVLILLNPIRFFQNGVGNFLTWFFIYCLFGGLVFYATALVSKNETPKITKSKPQINLEQ